MTWPKHDQTPKRPPLSDLEIFILPLSPLPSSRTTRHTLLFLLSRLPTIFTINLLLLPRRVRNLRYDLLQEIHLLILCNRSFQMRGRYSLAGFEASFVRSFCNNADHEEFEGFG